jgi:hypothetical protein
MPFNVFEWVGIVSRVGRLRWLAVYASMALVVLGWSLGLGCVYLGRRVWKWVGTVGRKIMDEVEGESDEEPDSEDGVSETARLLS